MPEPTTPPDPASFLPGYDCGHAVGHTEGYRLGHIDGYAFGYRQGIDEAHTHQQADDDAWYDEQCRKIANYAATTPPYADLADRRGQHDRAEAQRATLRERDIA